MRDEFLIFRARNITFSLTRCIDTVFCCFRIYMQDGDEDTEVSRIGGDGLQIGCPEPR